jgi:hypothetical protein
VAQDTAYATAEEFRDFTTNSTSTVKDVELGRLAVAASRELDHELGLPPAMLAPHSATYYFPASPHALHELRDERLRGYWLRAVDVEGIAVDSEHDGTFDGYTFDLTETWVRGWPRNATALGEPFKGLELFGGFTSAQLSTWASGPFAVSGDWGWAAIPEGAVLATLCIMRDVRDRLAAGPAGSYQLLQSGVVVRDDTFRTVNALRRPYGRRYAVGIA